MIQSIVFRIKSLPPEESIAHFVPLKEILTKQEPDDDWENEGAEFANILHILDNEINNEE